jgi:hypothetical protein
MGFDAALVSAAAGAPEAPEGMTLHRVAHVALALRGLAGDDQIG